MPGQAKEETLVDRETETGQAALTKPGRKRISQPGPGKSDVDGDGIGMSRFAAIRNTTKGKRRRRREQENTTGKHRASEGSPKEKGFSKGGSSAKHRAICAGEKRRRERCGCEDSRRQRSVLQKASEVKLYRGETRKQMACCGAVCYNKRHGKNAVSAAGGKRPRETALRIAYRRKGHKTMDGGKAGKLSGIKRSHG